MTNIYIFLKKSYSKSGGDANPDPVIKNQNWASLWTNSLKCYEVCFLLYVQVEVYQNVKTAGKVLVTCSGLI